MQYKQGKPDVLCVLYEKKLKCSLQCCKSTFLPNPLFIMTRLKDF